MFSELKKGGTEVRCRLVTGLGRYGLAVDFYKENEPVIESNKSGGFIIPLLMVFLGILTYNLIAKYLF